MTFDLVKKHQQALDRFRLVEQVEAEQRRRELEDLAFDAGDQWSDDAKVARGGSPAEGTSPAVPPRPMIVVRSLDQAIAQVINQARNARMAVKISPRSEGADQDTADVIAGIIRSIEYESRAQSVYLGPGAYQRAVIAGRGAAVVETEYASDEPGEWDQVLRIRGVPNGASIYVDPWTEDVNDPAGPRWGFRTMDYPEDVYKSIYGETALAQADTDSLLTSIADPKNSWITADTDGKPIYRVAEYWFIEEDKSTEVHPDDDGITRDVASRTLYWATINGVEFIHDPQELDGQFIPIGRVIGVEKNVGGKRSWEGMIRPNIGPCRMLNFAASSLMENMGLSTRGKWIGYTGQFEGHPEWDSANTRNWNKLEANATTDETGAQVLPLPSWTQAAPELESSMQCISVFTNFIRSSSGVPDAALGNVNPNDRSGAAIKQLQSASEQGTSNYPDHLRRFIEQIGHICLDRIPKIYDRPGRIIHILTGQTDEQSQVMLGQPYTLDQTGKPQTVMAPNGEAVMDPALASQMTNGQSKFIDLTKGKYSVVVEVGKSFATRRQEAVDAMTSLAAAAPELLPRYADLLVKSMDIPEGEAIAERLAPPGIGASNLPPAAQAQIQQLQQQLQQAQQAIATGAAKVQAETQGKIAVEQAKAQLSQQPTAADKVKYMIADLTSSRSAQAGVSEAALKANAAAADRWVETLEIMLNVAKEERLAAASNLVKAQTSVEQHRHDTMTLAMEHQHDHAMASQAHDHALEQVATQAALQPPPPSDDESGGRTPAPAAPPASGA
jgi:hypothetical protein